MWLSPINLEMEVTHHPWLQEVAHRLSQTSRSAPLGPVTSKKLGNKNQVKKAAEMRDLLHTRSDLQRLVPFFYMHHSNIITYMFANLLQKVLILFLIK